MARPMSSKEILGSGRFLSLVCEDGWEYAERRNVTAIVAMLAEVGDRLLLIEQYRAPVKSRVVELPAGLAGDVEGSEDEPIEEACQRELEEETGYRAERFTFLTRGPASAGACSEVISFFRAEGLRKVSEGGGHGGEDIQVHLVPSGDLDSFLEGKVREGVYVDPKVYAGLYFWLRQVRDEHRH